MKPVCPACGQPIPPASINVATDVALCPACGHLASLATLLASPPAPSAAPSLEHPPKGAWARRGMEGPVFGATTRSPIAFFLVPFMAVWSGFSLGGIYGSQIRNGEFNLFASLFGLPFLGGSILFGSIALMSICGKVEVRLRHRQGTIFTGIGPIGWTRRFNLDEVETIEETTRQSSRGRSRTGITLRGKSSLTFGTGLSEARRWFLLNVLRGLKANLR
jgi:hypothetical protein